MIHILVSIDKNYIMPLKTMLVSLVSNNPDNAFSVWLLHSQLPDEELGDLSDFCNIKGIQFFPVQISPELFEKAPTNRRYPQEMYYRLLASMILPESLDRILYLDPDILIINPLKDLWDLEMGDKTFAAASHTGITDFANSINKVRLATNHNYYNTGVILMNLEKARKLINLEEIFKCVEKYKDDLLLPDQDVFNHLYGRHTLEIDDAIWNYDARNYNYYFIRSTGEMDMNWVMTNTAILHYCGASKPWKKNYRYRSGILYKHYMAITSR